MMDNFPLIWSKFNMMNNLSLIWSKPNMKMDNLLKIMWRISPKMNLMQLMRIHLLREISYLENQNL